MSNDPNQIPTVQYGAGSSISPISVPVVLKNATATDGVTTDIQTEMSDEDKAKAALAAGKLWRPGYEYDPYDSPGERAEGMFIGQIVAKFTKEPDGFCSTYREWHIFVQGLYAGFRGKTFGDVPECPPLWSDESQYFEGAAMFSNVIKCNWIAVVGAGGAVAVGTYTGIIPPGTISAIIHNLSTIIGGIV